MILTPYNEFNLVIDSWADGTRPTSLMGTLATPGTNAYGTAATVLAGASVTDDAYEIEICFTGITTLAAIRDCLANILVDPAGGTSWTVLIPDLLCSAAGQTLAGNNGPAVWFRFPLFIKAGSSIGFQTSVNNATPGNSRCRIRLYCKPTRPELLKVGSFVRAFGADTANSRGTIITPGTAAEGSWVQLGSALAETLWWWEFGYGINEGDINQVAINVDIGIGDASNKKLAVMNGFVTQTSAEAVHKPSHGRFFTGVAGDLVYGRAQNSGTLDTDHSLAAYGVGG